MRHQMGEAHECIACQVSIASQIASSLQKSNPEQRSLTFLLTKTCPKSSQSSLLGDWTSLWIVVRRTVLIVHQSIAEPLLRNIHEPKPIAHKLQKVLMLKTDVPETLNEAIVAVKKMGRVGIIAGY